MIRGYEATPTIQDYESVDWQQIVADCEHKRCRDYHAAFLVKWDRATDETSDVNVYAQLAYLCNLVMPSDPSDAQYCDSFGGDLVLTDAQGEVLKELLPGIDDAEIRARIADVLWTRRIGDFYQTAVIAVDSYLESATNLEDPEKWTDCEQRIHRALHIAQSLGSTNNASLQKAISHIDALLDRYKGSDPLFLSVRVMQDLYEVGQGDSVKYAALCENTATIAEAGSSPVNWLRTREYWQMAAKWYSRCDDEENSIMAFCKAAETYVKEAHALADDYPQRSAVVSWHIQKAIEAYRRIPGTENRRQELHKKLLSVQAQSVQDLKSIQSTIDLNRIAQQAMDLVANQTFIESLFLLAYSVDVPNKTRIKKMKEEESKTHGLLYALTATQVSKQGTVTARRPGVLDDRELAIRAEMFREATFKQRAIANGVVYPGMIQINRDHYYESRDFLSFLYDNPFVPPDRQGIYALGLYEGLRGSIIKSVHLLVPQLENSIRYILQSCGYITSGLDSQQIQDEYSPNKLLYRFSDELEALFGEDLLFDIQGLLIERFGSNLRNLLAHGLVDSSEFNDGRMLYLWWITLRLCFTPILMSSDGQTVSESNDSAMVNSTDDNVPD